MNDHEAAQLLRGLRDYCRSYLYGDPRPLRGITIGELADDLVGSLPQDMLPSDTRFLVSGKRTRRQVPQLSSDDEQGDT